MSRIRVVQVVLIAAALAGATIPISPAVVERVYADSWYPRLQGLVTPWSNLSPISLFDVLLAVIVLVAGSVWIAELRRARRTRSFRPLTGAVLTSATAGAVIYLWFLAAWGLNYRRLPLEDAIGYDVARVTPQAVLALSERAVGQLNRTHAAAHASGFPDREATPPALVRGLHETERTLGRQRATTPSRPKRSLLGAFFQASGVDGMHAPFLFETLLNPALTPPERPAVLAHEWAHLAGYAPEDDASFVGLLAALRADAPSRYSAWMAILHETTAQVPAADRERLLAGLDEGPRSDRDAIRRRLEHRVDLVAQVSWGAYDQYLKAQGVREGVRSYSRVVNLLLGATPEVGVSDDLARGSWPSAPWP